jgi:hypothetical protein
MGNESTGFCLHGVCALMSQIWDRPAEGTDEQEKTTFARIALTCSGLWLGG